MKKIFFLMLVVCFSFQGTLFSKDKLVNLLDVIMNPSLRVEKVNHNLKKIQFSNQIELKNISFRLVRLQIVSIVMAPIVVRGIMHPPLES